MTNDEPLTDDLADLFASERRAPGAPEGAKGRMAARLALLPPIAVPLAAPATGLHSRAGAAGAWTRTHAWLASTAFVAGVVTGVGAMVVARPVSPPAAKPALPAPVLPAPLTVQPGPRMGLSPVAPVVSAPLTPAAPTLATPPTVRSALVSPPPPSQPSPASSSIAAEQVILDAARVALGREDAAAALAATETHAQRFPHGQLSEEREAIAIQALVLLGRPADARARTDRFARAYPTSALLPVLREALGDSQ